MQTELNLDHTDAWNAMAAVQEEMARRKKGVVIAVVDSHGEVLGLWRHSDAMLSSITVATNKAYTAARLRRPSAVVGKRVRDPQEGFDIAYYGDPRFVGFAGGIPVERNGKIIGAVGVSGLPEQEDLEIAEIAISAILAGWRQD